MKTLHLILKRKWFDMIASGEKTEEYRELSIYWLHRLCYYRIQYGCDCHFCSSYCLREINDDCRVYPFTAVTFQLGYQKNAPRMTFEIEEIKIGKGREEWGAEPNIDYFIIKLGKKQ